MTNMFKVFHNICIKNNLRYWCIGGTLIGVMRHKGWIPWDGDIDVSIIQEDFDKLIDICKTELPKNMFLQDYKTDKYFINDYDKFKRRAKIRDINSNYLKAEKKYHNGLQLDLMKVKIIKKNNKKYLQGDLGDGMGNTLDYNLVFPLKLAKFDNINVYIPNNSHKYLLTSPKLKNYNSMPEKNLRFPHEGKIELKACNIIKNKYPYLYE